MSTLDMFKKLMCRRKKISDQKLCRMVSDHRLGIQDYRSWDIRRQEFTVFRNFHFFCQDNTVIFFFTKERVAIAAPFILFELEEPLMPKTLMQKSVQIQYRSSITNDIENGALLISIDLPLDAFQIPKEDKYISLLELIYE